jgi:plastocyanin
MPSKLFAALVALILIIGACAGATTMPSKNPATSAPVPSSSTSSSAVEITVGTDTGAELKFDPAVLTVAAGAKVRVTFANRATVPHNLTFKDPINLATSTVVEPGTSGTVEFTAPSAGDYEFVCTLHPGMAGTLTVQNG